MPLTLSLLALGVVALVLLAYGVGALAGRGAGTRDGWLTGYRAGLRDGQRLGLVALPPAPVRNRLAARARWS